MWKFYLPPWLLASLITIVTLLLKVSHNINNFDKVLDSVLTFGSIVLGFLGALLGILVTIRNTKLVRTLFSNGFKNSIKYAFTEAIIVGFILVILSTIFHVIVDLEHRLIIYIFYVWIFIVTLFVSSAYRVISLLMQMLFRADEDSENNNGKSEIIETEKELIKEKLKKNSKSKLEKTDKNVLEVEYEHE